MSLINFVENRQDFLKVIEVFEFLDFSTIDESFISDIYDVLNNMRLRKQFVNEVCKMPTFLDGNRCLADSVDFNFLNQLLFRVNRLTNTIIVDEMEVKSLIFMLAGPAIVSSEVYNLINDCKIVSELNGYSIYTKSSLKEEINKEVEAIVAQLIKDNFDSIFTHMRNEILKTTDMDSLNNECISKIKLHYFKDTKLKPRNLAGLLSLHSEPELSGFIDSYLKDKHIFIRDVENAFYDMIFGDKCDIYLKKLAFNDFVVYHMCLEMQDSIKEELAFDYKLNKIKAVLKSLKSAGKTVTINGDKYENKLTNDTSYYIGDYNNNIHVSNIETIKFGKKVLFDAEVFKKEFDEKLDCLKAVN
jgi:hypothetical protein